jgi:hypothetical protein
LWVSGLWTGGLLGWWEGWLLVSWQINVLMDELSGYWRAALADDDSLHHCIGDRCARKAVGCGTQEPRAKPAVVDCVRACVVMFVCVVLCVVGPCSMSLSLCGRNTLWCSVC